MVGWLVAACGQLVRYLLWHLHMVTTHCSLERKTEPMNTALVLYLCMPNRGQSRIQEFKIEGLINLNKQVFKENLAVFWFSRKS